MSNSSLATTGSRCHQKATAIFVPTLIGYANSTANMLVDEKTLGLGVRLTGSMFELP